MSKMGVLSVTPSLVSVVVNLDQLNSGCLQRSLVQVFHGFLPWFALVGSMVVGDLVPA